jgi:hypothetical protein
MCCWCAVDCNNLGSQQWASFTDKQKANACTVIQIGKKSGFPEKGWVVAIAAALVESHVNVLSASAVACQLCPPRCHCWENTADK